MQDSGRAERVLKHSRALQSDARQLANDLAEAGREIRSKIDFSQAIQAHPFRAILIGAGIGYVLGGGLFSSLTRRMLRIGSRALIVPIVRGQVESMLGGPQSSGES